MKDEKIFGIIEYDGEGYVKLKRPANRYETAGLMIGELVQRKNAAYGDSFRKSADILKLLYPQGIRTDQYRDLLAIVRILDKLSRIGTDKDAFGENPWRDVSGYALLMLVTEMEREGQATP